MYGLRNLIAHEYFGIDYEMIWEIAKSNLPKNRNDLVIAIEVSEHIADHENFFEEINRILKPERQVLPFHSQYALVKIMGKISAGRFFS